MRQDARLLQVRVAVAAVTEHEWNTKKAEISQKKVMMIRIGESALRKSVSSEIRC